MEKTAQERIRDVVDGVGNWCSAPDWDSGKRGAAGCGAARMSAELYPYTAMASSVRVNRLVLRNRLVMAPMGNINAADETGRPSTRMVRYFEERAKGGTALITSGLVPVSHGIDPSVTEEDGLSYFPRIDRGRTPFSGWRDIAQACRAQGSAFFIQLTAGLGRVGSPECLPKKLKLPVSASWNPNFYMPGLPCRPLRDGELRRIVKNAGQAAADAKAAGIDGVYLHGHEGYLLEQLTNGAFNRRRFGRYADKNAFGLDLVREIRKRCGDAYPIMYRIDLSLALNETYGLRMATVGALKKFRAERSVAESLDYMAALVDAGVDLFDVDLGSYDNWWLPHPPAPMPAGCFLEVARVAKEDFARRGILSKAGLPVPIVAVGKLGYPDVAERALRDGDCDMIMLGRPLLADPQWPRKAFSGRVDQIRPCIGDQEGCINEFVEGGHPQCAVNPRTGFEDVFDGSELAPAATPRRIAVIGAGPAGAVCALTAAARGHAVTLYGKDGKIGGMILAGGVPRTKFDIENYRRYLEKALADQAAAGRVDLRLGSIPAAAELAEARYDAVVCATGTAPAKPPVPGIDDGRVVFAVDLFRNPDLALGKKHVVVVGGGEVGCECAHWLRTELGDNAVTVVEMLPDLMAGVCTANRGWLIHNLEKEEVRLLVCTRLAEVKGKTVRVVRNASATVPDPYVTWTPLLPENVPNPLAKPIKVEDAEEELPADLVVLAAGGRPDASLYRELVRLNAAPDLRIAGDAHRPGRVLEAVRSGYRIGIDL